MLASVDTGTLIDEVSRHVQVAIMIYTALGHCNVARDQKRVSCTLYCGSSRLETNSGIPENVLYPHRFVTRGKHLLSSTPRLGPCVRSRLAVKGLFSIVTQQSVGWQELLGRQD